MYWCNYYNVPANSNLEIKIPSCKTIFVTSAGTCRLSDLYHTINVVIQNNSYIKIPIVGVYSPATLIISNSSDTPKYVHLFYIENGGIPDDKKYRELWGVD